MSRHPSRVRALATIALILPLLAAAGASAQPREKSAPHGATPAMAREIAVKTLKNGMTVIVWPDHDVPNVAMYTLYRVGSRNERQGITGISHFFEHMMFNGSKNYPSGAYDRLLEAAGGSNNAYTSENVTCYQNWIPKGALETIFRLEADRICCLSLDSAAVANERGVVYSERRTTTDDNPESFLDEQVQATAFVAHPYGIPVIGWPSDIERWSQADLRDYFHTYYAPNNATMVFAGDVTPEEIFALAAKHLEGIPAQTPPPAVRTIEPQQLGERRVVVRRPGSVPYLQFAFHAGRANDPDVETLDLLSTILTGGESSRLYRRLVDRDQVAIGLYDYFLRGFDPGLYRILVTVSPDKGAEPCEKALLEELSRVGREGVTPPELTKAKNVAIMNFWRRMATIDGKAATLADAQVFRGNWRDAFAAPDRYARVTAHDIQAAAKRLFDEKNRTVGVFLQENEPVAGAAKGGAR